MNRRTVLLMGSAALLASAGGVAAVVAGMGSTEAYAARAADQRRALPNAPELDEFVRFATLAANGHNTQPWRFFLSPERITIRPDFSRRTPVVDPDDHHLYASLGCAVENLALAALARGRPADIGFDPSGDGALIAHLGRGAAMETALFAAIPRRQSTRGVYDGGAVGPDDLQALEASARLPGVDIAIATDRRQIARYRDLIVAGNTAQMNDPAFVRELKHWIRFSPSQAMLLGDGLYAAASGNPLVPEWLGRAMFDVVFRVDSENDKYARQIDSSSGIAVFSAVRDDRAHWVLAGRACQRFCLQASALGLTTAFVNQPTEVVRLRSELAALAGFPGRRPNLVLRFGRAAPMPMSPRRHVGSVIEA